MRERLFFLREKKEHIFPHEGTKNNTGKKKFSLRQRAEEKEGERRGDREEAVADMERLKLGPTKLWTGLVLHHKDVFVSHVISRLNRTCLLYTSPSPRDS